MLAGTYMGMANFPEVDPVNDQFFMRLLDWAQIKRPFTTSADGRTSDQVEVRLQTYPGGSVLYLINHSSKKEDITVELVVNKQGNYRIRNIIDDTEFTAKSDDKILVLSVSLSEKERSEEHTSELQSRGH